MISALVFSKDRAAQLDLLLRSMQTNAPVIYPRTQVIFTATYEQARAAYEMCANEHPDVGFWYEQSFAADTTKLLRDIATRYAMTLCDDDVFYQPLPKQPGDLLAQNASVLTVSLRLGANTTQCYALRKPQELPSEVAARWDPAFWHWRHGDGDFNYPGSLDGNVWRTEDLRTLIENSPIPWENPNTLEDALNRACRTALRPGMACYRQSVLVGLPLNSVQDAYKTNRNGEKYPARLEMLNAKYLNGERLSLDSIIPNQVDSAHCEFGLFWNSRVPIS